MYNFYKIVFTLLKVLGLRYTLAIVVNVVFLYFMVGKGEKIMANLKNKKTAVKPVATTAKTTPVATAQSAVAAAKTAKPVAKEEPVAAKTPVKAEVKETPAAAKTPAKAEGKETAKAVAPKAAAKKAPAKKAAKKPAAKKVVKEAVEEVFFEYNGEQLLTKEIVERVKEAYKNEGHRVGAIKSLRIYINPDERKAYYVINDKAEGKFVEF